jgi:hypothetical protein
MTGTPHRRDLWVACGLLTGVLVPVLGYASLFGAHPADGSPWWVRIVLPGSAFGPDTPGVAMFAGLALLHALLWFAVGFGLARAVEAIYRRVRA